MKTTSIEWCDSTVNPSMGCDGCELWTRDSKVCYAGKIHKRRVGHLGFAPSFQEVTEFPGRMADATRWSDLINKDRPDKPWLNGMPRCIFVSDMSDLLSASISFEYIFEEVMSNVLSEYGKRHRWLWLTKRPKRMKEFSHWTRHTMKVQWPINLWVGTSITSRGTLGRVGDLLQVGSDHTRRFLSVEPQWELITIGQPLRGIDWVIQGGESGSAQRPFDISWADSLREECQHADVPYFLKQLGKNFVSEGHRLYLQSSKGNDWSEWPERLRVREIPQPLSPTEPGYFTDAKLASL
ncbi:DUF5131 family protein [Calycomorphotria hydatis]|uniref:Phage protein Gp37/Gp68 n=1 Tax=Calycomorphotria hydatis TaxID=2528027 RepID=A0A517TE26_9PLAN|nr:Phage protein Gp37/Gp68 [Calycomorphotria hydatis]